MKNYIITEELRQGLMQYLMNRPLKEAYQMFNLLNEAKENIVDEGKDAD